MESLLLFRRALSSPTMCRFIPALSVPGFSPGFRCAAQNKTLTSGCFALMPAGMNHYAFTTAKEITIVLYGQWPIEFKCVDPADDPRNSRKMK
jgi:hypothetical protein